MFPVLSALPLFVSKEVRALLKVAVPLLVVGLVVVSPAAAKSGTDSRDGGAVHASGGGGVLVYPAAVNRRLLRGEKTLERAGDYVDRDMPDKAITSLLNARRNMYAAWRGAKYVIDHAPPPPVAAGSLGRGGKVHMREKGDIGGTPASPADTAFVVLDYQHDVATTAFGLIDGAKGTLLAAVNKTIFAALNRRDQAIDYIHQVAPPPPVAAGSVRTKRDDAVHTSGAPVASTFDTVMPNLVPELDDELQQIGSQLDGGAVVPTGKSLLGSAQAQITKTEATVNQFWPPLPAG
jgi:hypothetical protein